MSCPKCGLFSSQEAAMLGQDEPTCDCGDEEGMKEVDCDGRCNVDAKGNEHHLGTVVPVLVRGRHEIENEAWRFNYCEVAIETDRNAGFVVELEKAPQ